MTRIWFDELGRHVGEEVEVAGWVFNFRSSGKIHFIQLRDGTARVQAVCAKDDVADDVFARCDGLTMESSVRVVGVVREDARAPGGVELLVRDLRVISPAREYPIQKKEHGVDFLLDRRHLWLRSPRQEAVLKVRATAERAISDFFDERGFVRVDAPILTPTSPEGTTTLFQTDYFGQTAFLSQSGQLYMEAAAAALGKVYCAGPTFRAEKSKTRRHVMEFWMFEPEVAFLDHEGNISLAENLVTAVVTAVLGRRRAELDVLKRDVAALERVKPPFPRVTYYEARGLLASKGYDLPWGGDLGGDEQTALAREYDTPFIVEKFPLEAKAFYMKRCEDDARLTYSIDVFAPEGYGEIIGGSCREDDLGKLLENVAAHGLPLEPLEWYLDLRRYGAVPTAGFGLGLGRTVMWICGLKHIREAIPFPRMLNRFYP
ncbi:MAG TPA: asparagine--tRNA ligase [bacterium]|nr:asparagine--tRNA ligase [bacterium]